MSSSASPGLAQTFPSHFTPAEEVGWRPRPVAWGVTVDAPEAAEAALGMGSTERGSEIVSMTTATNVRRSVMERIGMTRDLADDFLHPNGPRAACSRTSCIGSPAEQRRK